MKINLLTCTKDRPEALELCRKYVTRSVRKPDRWLIVDDGMSPCNQKDIPDTSIYTSRRCPRSKEPAHTLPLNLLYSVSMWERYPNEILVFWEDDDWYAPDYLTEVEKAFEKDPTLLLYGQQLAPYYRVRAREWAIMPNTEHSSLCATAMRITPATRLVFELAAADVYNPFVDVRLWQSLNPANVLLTPHKKVVGIKQMPGTVSTTYGWTGGDLFQDDPNGGVLKRWIGNDASLYEGFMK